VPVAELMSSAQALARQIADKAPIALRYAKESVVGGLGLPLADGVRLENDLSALLRTTEDRVEGVKAFVEKRKPKWSGK
jgi:Enoyl-CoA hydratase/carnithine racemase